MQKAIMLISSLLFLMALLIILGVPLNIVIGCGTIVFFFIVMYHIIGIVENARLRKQQLLQKSMYYVHRFVIVPGYVTINGTKCWVSAGQLIKLYHLNHDEYIIHSKDYKYSPSDIMLTPLRDGDYLGHKDEIVNKFYRLQAV